MPLSNVIHEHRTIDHEDDRRSIITAFNGDLCEFRAAQVKFLTVKQLARLGGHYHDYAELFYLLSGDAEVKLEDVKTKEQQTYKLTRNDRIFIPAQIAHEVSIAANSVLVGCTENKYVSAAANDIPYGFTK